MKKVFFSILTASALIAPAASAQTTWDGGGGADTSWGTAANWDNDTLPAFDGTDSLTVNLVTANKALTLGGNRSIGRITFGANATAAGASLSGDTLRLNSTTTSAAAGAALWNAATDNANLVTVNSNILLQSGTAGNYTGYFYENNNSGNNAGTKFSGSITQGAGENWTLRFARASARGQFFLNNASNSISVIRNDGADVYSDVVGAFGGASITMSGGSTGTRITDHYTTAVSNNITLLADSKWAGQIQTRLTGSLAQSTFALTYGVANTGVIGNGVLTRLEYSSLTGTGTTTLIGGAISTSSMSNLATGTLNLGSSSSSSSIFVLSGTSGNSVPTWADFSAARTNNQAGGTGTWRIDTGTAGTNTGNFGGFAARGADLVIPASGPGLSSATFARNFQMGSVATLNGAQYATNTVTIQTDIAYGSVASANRYFVAAANAGSSKTTTLLTLAGPVHELSGKITGDSVVMYPSGMSNTQMGMFRISNSSNELTGTSRWILGGNRNSFTTLGGGVIAAGANSADASSVVGIFTSDGAFGGATEVNVASQSSSGSQTTGTLLFEDVNGSGSTTFTRNINLQNNVQATSGSPAWGSYGGDVIYTGTATHGGSLATANDSIIHVQSGTMQLGVNGGAAATITNNRTLGTTHNKSGAGTLRIDNLTVNGTQATNNWNVRAGTMIVNTTVAGAVAVSSGGTLGGSGTMGGSVTSAGLTAVIAPGNSTGKLTISGAGDFALGATFKMELGANTTPGTTYDQLAIGGLLTGSTAANGMQFQFSNIGAVAGVTYTLLTFGSSAGFTEADLAMINSTGFVLDTGFDSNGWLINGNNLQVQFSAVPEPATWGLLAFSLTAVMVLRRRKRS